MALSLAIFSTTPIDIAHDGLPAGMDMNMLDRHFLLPAPPTPIERVGQPRECTADLDRKAQFFPADTAVLPGEHGAPCAVHGGGVKREHLGRQHLLDGVTRSDVNQPGCGGIGRDVTSFR